MNDHTFETLGLDSLIELLAGHCQTPMGRALALQLHPSTSFDEVNKSLDLTTECVAYLKSGSSFGLGGLSDPGDALAELQIQGARLEPLQILEITRIAHAASDLRQQSRAADFSRSFPLLAALSSGLPDLRNVVEAVAGKILPNGEIDDSASPTLRRIRREIGDRRRRVYDSLESIMRSQSSSIQEELVTIRNGRFVIPVKTDARGHVPGVVHGASSSGVTSFVEPLGVIEQNNDLVRLQEQEEQEIASILFEITEALRANSTAITAGLDAIAQTDLAQAKARMAVRFNCVRPEISRSRRFLLKEARHPILEDNLKKAGGRIVPISFEMDESHQVMIISGPNAGGKTVTLKTAGVLALMAQMGLHVPAAEAAMTVYEQVFADIGDQQSIAANLSTFTAHIRNVADMARDVKPPALVLVDEVGTGTDPDEGAALAVAIVDYFNRRGAAIIATTHYNRLKVWASEVEGVLNASVEFDEETLSPTYRLLTGVAGASSGLEIARRVGLPDDIAQEARKHLDPSHEQTSNYLKRLKSLADETQAQLAALEDERAATAEKFASLDIEFAAKEARRRQEFELELQTALRDFGAEAEREIAAIKDKATASRLRKDAESRKAELSRTVAVKLRKLTPAVQSSRPAVSAAQPAAAAAIELAEPDARIGERDRVLISSLGREGTVESISGGTYTVAVGALKYRANRNELQLLKPEKPAAAAKSSFTSNLEDRNDFVPELKLIGNTVDEATDKIDKFLDEAYLAGASEVRIIHGHGTGALRSAVANWLKGHPHVESYHAAAREQGGSGATIAILKK